MSLWLDFRWAGEQGRLLALPSLVILPWRRAGEARAEVLCRVFSACAPSPSLAWAGLVSHSPHLARVAGQMGVMLITRPDATAGFSAPSLKMISTPSWRRPPSGRTLFWGGCSNVWSLDYLGK